jgi:L-ascorbate metabolism protein UlaG (beta-lactamase superfamily)
MRIARIFSFWIVVLLCIASCTHKIEKFYPEIVTAKPTVPVPLVAKGTQKVSVTYLGCGNMVLEHNGEAIMTDPFFSNQKLLALAGKIRTKEHLYREWKGNLEAVTARSAVQAMLVSHTHYDHVMDLPTILHDHYLQNLKVVYGNRYMPQMLTHFKNEGVAFDSLKRADVYDPTEAGSKGDWVQVTPRMRFLPIRSNHAPHTKNKLFMSKPLKPGYFDKKLVWHNDKVCAFKWTVGDSYSFLIDFIQKDTLRVFVQTSASDYPFGLPPEAELKDKPVDIAFMCYASAMNVAEYPKKWIDQIKPKRLVLIHWEDFFKQPPTDGKFRLVRGTKPHRVRERIDDLGQKKDYFIMPKPGTRLDVMF